jgi:hypothetical protein
MVPAAYGLQSDIPMPVILSSVRFLGMLQAASTP